MTTLWLYRINIIIPDMEKNAHNALWTVIAPEGDIESNTFGVPLSFDGNEPATHRVVSTAATEEMRIFITEIFADELSNAIISVQDYRENDWETLLRANGLQVIQSEVL